MFLLFLQHLLFYFFLFSFVTFILQGMDENKAQALTFPRVSITRPLNFNTARNAATGLVSMSTRPDPKRSDTVETRKRHLFRVVWDLHIVVVVAVVGGGGVGSRRVGGGGWW